MPYRQRRSSHEIEDVGFEGICPVHAIEGTVVLVKGEVAGQSEVIFQKRADVSVETVKCRAVVEEIRTEYPRQIILVRQSLRLKVGVSEKDLRLAFLRKGRDCKKHQHGHKRSDS